MIHMGKYYGFHIKIIPKWHDMVIFAKDLLLVVCISVLSINWSSFIILEPFKPL